MGQALDRVRACNDVVGARDGSRGLPGGGDTDVGVPSPGAPGKAANGESSSLLDYHVISGEKALRAPCSLTKIGESHYRLEVMSKMNRNPTIRPIGEGKYMVVGTGEEKEFQPRADRRVEVLASLRQSFKKLRVLVSHNFSGGNNEAWWVVTYKENMQDRERLMEDLKNFMKRVRYHWGKFEYMTVPEPQGRGAWHANVLVKRQEGVDAYIPHKDLESLWGHGFVWVRKLIGVDDIGAYLSAYLADVPVEEYINIPDDWRGHEGILEKEKGKKFVKGARLRWYPSGMHLYRRSKGIVEPEKEFMHYGEALKVVGHREPDWVHEWEVDTEGFRNQGRTEVYHLRRGTSET